MTAMSEIPAGRHWCYRCFAEQDFILAEDASPDDPECPLECFACGKVYGQIVEEVDPVTGWPLEVPRTRPAISRAQREAARQRMREEFRAAVIRDGARLENFRATRRRGGVSA